MAMNFSTTQVHLSEATWDRAGLMCGLPWLHIEVDEERLSRAAEFCLPLICAVPERREGGREGGLHAEH